MWKFFVKQQKIEIMEREVIADHQIAFVNLKFVFDNEWKKFHKVVQFTQCDETYNRVLGLDNTSCLLPAELHAGTVKMSVFGYDTETDKGIRATTAPVILNIRPSGFVSDGTEEIPPTPDLYTQLLQRLEEKASSLKNGFDGKDGLSAYEIAIENGYDGTVSEWLDSLKGDTGLQGETGANGADGQNGKSAYEIWLTLGNSGTESDFLNSLKGNTGQNGISPSVSLTEQENGILMSVIDAESTKTALIKHGNNEDLDLTPYATKDEVGQQIKDITNALNTNAGKIVTGKVYTVNGTQYTAGTGAEIFNDYENNKAIGKYSHSEGGGNTASGEASHAEGGGTTASGSCAHSEGGGTTASGSCAHSEGGSTTASGSCAHSEGGSTTASGDHSHAEGMDTKSEGSGSHSEGGGTTASGNFSHAEGQGTTASGSGSHTEGCGTTASKDGSHAEGYATKAIGQSSHTEGGGTTASGDCAHSEGGGTIASGDYSHSEGCGGTTASGTSSHAEGMDTEACGDYSHTEGLKTIACSEASHAMGKYNVRDTENKYVFIIGNGISSKRSNAFAIDWDGNIYVNNSDIPVNVLDLLNRLSALEGGANV